MTETSFWEELRTGRFARMVREEARGRQLFNSREVYNVMKPLFAEHDDVETVFCIFLDTRNRIISIDKMFSGSISNSIIHPREIIKRVIAVKASNIVMAHNHPSGSVDPSQEDMRITRVLVLTLTAIDVQLHDHIIIGDGYHSMADHGLIRSYAEEFKNILAC